MSSLEEQFHQAMVGIYKTAKDKVGYNATRFIQMVSEIGGLATAKELVMTSKPSEGYTAIWEKGRLDITVEALIIKPQWQPLFTEEELTAARKRLTDYDYDGERYLKRIKYE